MPVLLKGYEELKDRVLSKTKNVKKIKVTKAPDFSKVKVLTTRRMYVIVVQTDKLEETLNNIKNELGVEELEVEMYELKKPLYKKD
jgi:ribosomal protein S3